MVTFINMAGSHGSKMMIHHDHGIQHQATPRRKRTSRPRGLWGGPIRATLAPQEYIHRLGRTGRAGAKGQGLLLLHEFERGAASRKGGVGHPGSSLRDAKATPYYQEIQGKSSWKSLRLLDV